MVGKFWGRREQAGAGSSRVRSKAHNLKRKGPTILSTIFDIQFLSVVQNRMKKRLLEAWFSKLDLWLSLRFWFWLLVNRAEPWWPLLLPLAGRLLGAIKPLPWDQVYKSHLWIIRSISCLAWSSSFGRQCGCWTKSLQDARARVCLPCRVVSMPLTS